MKNKKLVVEITLFVVLSLLSIGSLSYSIYTYNNPKVIYVKGEKGEDGKDGEQGPPGKDGVDGINGSTGAKGEKGDTGEQGPQGDPGKDGSSFLTGTGEPSTSLGKDGDTYLDLSTYKLYSKNNGVWTMVGSLKDESSSISIEDTTTSYSISITPSSKGTISANKSIANKDDLITFTVIPQYGYRLEKFYINSEEYSFNSSLLSYPTETNEINYYMRNKDIVVSAEYEEDMGIIL